MTNFNTSNPAYALLNSISALCNPFALGDVDVYLRSIKDIEKSLHDIMPESGFDHEAFIIMLTELETIYSCVSARDKIVLVYWSKVERLLPLFDRIMVHTGDYETLDKMDKIFFEE